MRVLAASFTFCDDETCTFTENTHLVVSRSYVPLETGNAIAISYTWGEFDRHEMSLGHDENGDNVSMVLGCEWDRSDVVEKLLNMAYSLTTTEAPMPFWIDQLCIPQDNEAVIRATLAAIPSIFNIFDAVALLPGSPCKCLREGIEEHGQHQLSNPSPEQLAQLSIEWAQKMGLCLNSISFCSYFERVWTRQEMMYTRKMHVEWTGSNTPSCVVPSATEGDIMLKLLNLDNENEDLDSDDETASDMEKNLTPFALQIYQRALSAQLTHTHALALVKMRHDKSWHNAVLAFEDFLSRDIARTYGRYYAIEALTQFLAGMPLEMINAESQDAILTDAQKLRKFASRLSGVGWVQRSATRERDYVLAVWIDCPRYAIPEDYATMSLSCLLEDAISQMERNFNVTVPVTAFAGLFGPSKPSMFWRPALYLPRLNVSHTQHVYGPVVSECPLLPIASVPSLALNVYRRGAGRARNQVLLTDFVRGRTPDDILRLVRTSIMWWPNATIERIISARQTSVENPEAGINAGVSTMLLIAHPLMNELCADTVRQFRTLESMNLDSGILMIENDLERFLDIVFELVCEALGLFLTARQFRQCLPLVVHVGEEPALGICRKEWAGQNAVPSRQTTSSNYVTVCLDDVAPGSGYRLLEAARLDAEEDSTNTYVAVGTWVPQRVTPWQDVTALRTDELQNATLV